MAIPFPSDFLKRTRAALGSEETALLTEALDGVPPVSIRYNPFKTGKPDGDDRVPWCRYGRYLPQRPSFTLDPAFHAGVYYVQEAGSMFIEHLVRSISTDTPMRILDLCAAPGGKTTLLSTLAGPQGLVVANETIRSRALALADNVRKWGIGNVVVTNDDPSRFAPFEHYFDLILIDAPCSGEGMFRKTPQAREQWSEANVKLCAARSRRILAEAWGSLRPGGVLIYSTCTFNREENEETVAWIAREYGCRPLSVETDPAWGILRGESEGIPTFRFHPHRTRSEGFFCAAMTKEEGRIREKKPKPRKTVFSDLSRREAEAVAPWIEGCEHMRLCRVGENIHAYYRDTFASVKQLSENLNVLYSGVSAGPLFGNKLRPDHPLALFIGLSRGHVPETDLSEAEALEYLRKNDISPDALRDGINLIACGGYPLGWAKRIGTRINNLYPKELRIMTL